MLITINDARTLILSGQCLLDKDKNSVVQVVSDLSGIQYDPCPILHLNHYLALWSRVPGFKVTDYDRMHKELEQVKKRLAEAHNLIAVTFEKPATGILYDKQLCLLNGRYLSKQDEPNSKSANDRSLQEKVLHTEN